MIMLRGSWTAEFVVDTLSMRSVSAPGAAATGTITFGDSTYYDFGPSRRPVIEVQMAVDFTPILGRRLSCWPPFRNVAEVEGRPDSLRIWMTPGAFDCGLVLMVRFVRGELVGRWTEPGYITQATGRVRLARVAP